MPKQKGSVDTRVYQLKVTLEGVEPPIWRRMQVPGDTRLSMLHRMLQVVMGWTNSHLHEFVVGRTRYGEPDPGFYDPELRDDRRTRLNELARGKGAEFVYVYDLGDNWEHRVLVEDVLETVGKPLSPRCLAGERACPPEDSGGAVGYAIFREAMMNSGSESHELAMEWYGEWFDPEEFELDPINRRLASIGGPRAAR